MFLEPVDDAATVFLEQQGGADDRGCGPSQDADPAVQRSLAAHQGRSKQVEHLRERVVEDVAGAVRKAFRQPEHRRQEHQHLHDAGDDLRDVAKPRADEPERNADRMRVDQQQQECRDDEQRRPRQRDSRPDRHRYVDHDLMEKLDDVARHASPDEKADRKVALLQIVAGTGEDVAPFVDQAGEEAPEDDSECQVREELGKFGAEQRAVERTHAADHGGHAQREPQRPQH